MNGLEGDCKRLIQTHRRVCWQIGMQAVQSGAITPDQLRRIADADVGHTQSSAVYEENQLSVQYYEPDERRHETPIFVVYALINRPYVLDLQPDRSVVRRFLEAGFPVYLVDWGEPSRLDASLSLSDYVCRYLDNCVDAVLSHADADDLHMLGYCMGGTMAAMYAAREQDPIRTLSWLAMPYAFDGNAGILERWARHLDTDAAVEAAGTVSGDVLAVEFSLLDPVDHYLGKYVRLWENVEDEAFVANFARMERWIWDAVDVAGETFREFVCDLYQENQLARGEFELGGQDVDVSGIDVPVLGIVGQYDDIVPAESSTPFVDDVESDDTQLIEFPAGHIGISVSSSAHEHLWPDATDWYAARSVPAGERADEAVAPDSPQTDARASVENDRERAKRTVETVAQRAAAQMTGAESDRPAVDLGDATAGDPAASRSVASVDGIGPTYAQRLERAGVETVADLRVREALALADIADVPPSRARDWLDRAP